MRSSHFMCETLPSHHDSVVRGCHGNVDQKQIEQDWFDLLVGVLGSAGSSYFVLLFTK